MKLSSFGIPVVIVLLVAGVFFAGCSDSSTTTTETTPSVVTTTITTAGALYSAGDIIKNPKSTAKAGLLIIDYDAGTDKYERAYIYPNSDGSWGYRLDSKTEKVSRVTLEKTYTEKVKTVAVSAVPVGAPTTAATVAATHTTKTTTVATTATTAAVSAPKVKDITPYSGKTGTTVEITELEGQYFREGANVSLKKSGETSIVATDIDVVSSILITCTFEIPSDTETGYWDVVVTNPDGQYHKFQNGFNILQGSTTTTTTTTSSAATTAITITQIQDTLLVTGCNEGYKTVSILGTNLTAASNMKLTGTSTITATTYSSTASTLATGYFTIPTGSCGTYYVNLVDSSGTVLAKSSDTLTIQ